MKAETNGVVIKYMRIAPINGRKVAFCQLFNEDGTKLFPSRVPDVPLFQVLDFIEKEDLELTNANDILDDLVRVHGFSA